ncbi:MAG TPA: methylated-DNA--[protein]-cysteine S-methyltransferase [Egibacteraceae bacterium]|nr:methylated-DNA--[protein]-cysteine S-methyltransferase [Egibacteraceae bacterium]
MTEPRPSDSPAGAWFAALDSVLGPLSAAATGAGVIALKRQGESSLDEFAWHLEAALGERVEHRPDRFAVLQVELDEYFAGARTRFDASVDLRLVRGFARLVLEATLAIPYGSRATYGELAAEAGSPGAARAAGTAQARSPMIILVPCHRVVPAGGGIGGYGGGEDVKAFLLELERTTLGSRARTVGLTRGSRYRTGGSR